MTTFETIIRLLYLSAAITFVLGLDMMRSPSTARRANLLSAVGMAVAVAATVAWVATSDHSQVTAWGWAALIAGAALGTAGGLWGAKGVKMTAMPQMVSIFNAVGGGAAAVVAYVEMMRVAAGLGARTCPSWCRSPMPSPAARRKGNPISGMPILDVDKARQLVVIKRSLGHGYAGLDNELYGNPRTGD